MAEPALDATPSPPHSCATLKNRPTLTGAPTCAQCALQLEHVVAMQQQRGFRVRSQFYSAPRDKKQPLPVLHVLTQCTSCSLTLTWSVDELMDPETVICPTCALTHVVRAGPAAYAYTNKAAAAAAAAVSVASTAAASNSPAVAAQSSHAASSATAAAPMRLARATPKPTPTSLPAPAARTTPTPPAAAAQQSVRLNHVKETQVEAGAAASEATVEALPATTKVPDLSSSSRTPADQERLSLLSLLCQPVAPHSSPLPQPVAAVAASSATAPPPPVAGSKAAPIELDDEDDEEDDEDDEEAPIAPAHSARVHLKNEEDDTLEYAPAHAAAPADTPQHDILMEQHEAQPNQPDKMFNHQETIDLSTDEPILPADRSPATAASVRPSPAPLSFASPRVSSPPPLVVPNFSAVELDPLHSIASLPPVARTASLRRGPNLVTRPKRKATDAAAASSSSEPVEPAAKVPRDKSSAVAAAGATKTSAAATPSTATALPADEAAAAAAATRKRATVHVRKFASRAATAAATRAAAAESKSTEEFFASLSHPVGSVAERIQRQHAKFAEARRRLDMRRSLNLEPEPQAETEPLPFHSRARRQQAADAAANAAAAMQNAAAAVRLFTLPTFFRSENAATPYTAAERALAMSHLIDSDARKLPKCDALCLPGMQPRVWCTKVRAAVAAVGGKLSDAHYSSPSALLAHHYRRLAKLVHPDKCVPDMRDTAERAFKILHESYQSLQGLV